MRILIVLSLFAVVSCAQKPAQTTEKAARPKLERTPSLQLVQTADAVAVVDTDMFDAQKYVEQTGGDSSNEKTKRSDHERGLTREFFDGFNATKECDGILLVAKNGDQKPEFNLQVLVDSHDTPGQKPVWIWILNDDKSKFVTKGEEDSSAVTAKNVCLAVWKAAEDEQLRASRR